MLSVTAAQMRKIDRRATEEFGIPGIILMENAGRAVADAAEIFLPALPAPSSPKSVIGDPVLHCPSQQTIAIVCGTGNNGGDGYVAARQLHSRGYRVRIIRAREQEPATPDAAMNFQIVRKLALPSTVFSGDTLLFTDTMLIIDALLGTGLSKPVTEPYSSLIKAMNDSGVPILSIDIPSGIHADTGELMGTAVRAACTVTFGFQKTGLTAAQEHTGRVIIANISLPKQLL